MRLHNYTTYDAPPGILGTVFIALAIVSISLSSQLGSSHSVMS